MRIRAILADKPLIIDPSAIGPDAQLLQSILDMQPPVPAQDLDALESPLRGYQRTGAGWRFCTKTVSAVCSATIWGWGKRTRLWR